MHTVELITGMIHASACTLVYGPRCLPQRGVQVVFGHHVVCNGPRQTSLMQSPVNCCKHRIMQLPAHPKLFCIQVLEFSHVFISYTINDVHVSPLLQTWIVGVLPGRSSIRMQDTHTAVWHWKPSEESCGKLAGQFILPALKAKPSAARCQITVTILIAYLAMPSCHSPNKHWASLTFSFVVNSRDQATDGCLLAGTKVSTFIPRILDRKHVLLLCFI